MSRARLGFAAWVSGAALAGLAVGMNISTVSASAPAAAVQQCPAGVSPACAGWQDTNGKTLVQDLVLTDHNGAPVWWINDAGGMWVGNDRLGVTGKSVYDHAAYLAVPDGIHGQVVIGGRVLTAAGIRLVNCLLAGGTVRSCRH